MAKKQVQNLAGRAGGGRGFSGSLDAWQQQLRWHQPFRVTMKGLLGHVGTLGLPFFLLIFLGKNHV